MNQDDYSHLPLEFNEIVDKYNEIIQKANQLRKTKNEENKSASPKSKPLIDDKYKPQLESLSLELKALNSSFSTMMDKYLTAYKADPLLQNTLVFPSKLIGDFRKIIHDLGDKHGLIHESIGTGASRKLIVSKEVLEFKPHKKIKTEIITKKTLKTLEFPPDEITIIKVLSINEDVITFLITPPESFDNPIKGYNLYDNEIKEADSTKVLYSVENTNEVRLDLNSLKAKEGTDLCFDQSFSNKTFIKFKLSSINQYGESFLSNTFQILFNKPRKGKAYCSGSCQKNKIPRENLKLHAETPFNPFFIEIPLFSKKTNSFKSKETTLLLLDSGTMVQWGFSLSSSESKKINEDSMNEIYSEPFLLSTIIVHTFSVGVDFCALVSCQGEVFTWGYNQFGQLGIDDRVARAEPTLIKTIKDSFIIDISCGNQHCLALDSNSKVYVWGRNQAIIGQTELLDPYGKVNNYQNIGVHQFRPRHMKEVLGYYKIKKISAGGFHNAVITENEELYIWGDNESNQLGLKDLDAINITIAKQIELFQTNKFSIIDVSCGGLHTLALVRDKNDVISLWSWGDETQGQCGSGEKKTTQNPKQNKFFDGKQVEMISAGSFHSLIFVKEDGIYGFGYNGSGELGMKTQKNKVRTPIKIESIPEGRIEEMVAGFEISCLTIT